jgi:hemerythrin-like domain-containing protein
MTDLSLRTRAGLPPALRVLVAEMPRLSWPDHPRFHGLASFWLEKHLEFRRLTSALLADADRRLDAGIDPQDHARRVARLGGHLVNGLHGHHQIEDAHYFPEMARMEPRVAQGFDLLDADHQAMDGLLADFVAAANAVIGLQPGAEGRYRETVAGFEHLLIRHLEDEEELVVPVILRTGLG